MSQSLAMKWCLSILNQPYMCDSFDPWSKTSRYIPGHQAKGHSKDKTCNIPSFISRAPWHGSVGCGSANFVNRVALPELLLTWTRRHKASAAMAMASHWWAPGLDWIQRSQAVEVPAGCLKWITVRSHDHMHHAWSLWSLSIFKSFRMWIRSDFGWLWRPCHRRVPWPPPRALQGQWTASPRATRMAWHRGTVARWLVEW